MRYETWSPVKNLRGTNKNTDAVFTARGGKNIIQARTPQDHPRSPDQQFASRCFAQASAHWKMLTGDQRRGWTQYAHQWCHTNAEGKPVVPMGLSTYTSANSVRQVLGLPLSIDPPALPPPNAPLAIEYIADEAADLIRFRLHHGLASIDDFIVLAYATPPMPSVATTPRLKEHILVCGPTPASSAPLQPSGGLYTFPNTKHTYHANARFGIMVKLARTPDCLVGPPWTIDVTRPPAD